MLAPQTGKSKYRFYEASFIPRTMGNEALINAQVIACHSVGRETFLECPPAGATTQLRNAADRAHGLIYVVHLEACLAVLKDFRDRATAEGHDRRAARQRLDQHQAERLRPVDRE